MNSQLIRIITDKLAYYHHMLRRNESVEEGRGHLSSRDFVDLQKSDDEEKKLLAIFKSYYSSQICASSLSAYSHN